VQGVLERSRLLKADEAVDSGGDRKVWIAKSSAGAKGVGNHPDRACCGLGCTCFEFFYAITSRDH